MGALVIPADEDKDGCLPWLVYMQREDEGRRYIDVFFELVKDPMNPVQPLGILRHPESGGKPYVVTNPSADTQIRGSDMMYVLGDWRFGKAAFDRGVLPLSGTPTL